jgi:hypothetical protein
MVSPFIGLPVPMIRYQGRCPWLQYLTPLESADVENPFETQLIHHEDHVGHEEQQLKHIFVLFMVQIVFI